MKQLTSKFRRLVQEYFAIIVPNCVLKPPPLFSMTPCWVGFRANDWLYDCTLTPFPSVLFTFKAEPHHSHLDAQNQANKIKNAGWTKGTCHRRKLMNWSISPTRPKGFLTLPTANLEWELHSRLETAVSLQVSCGSGQLRRENRMNRGWIWF